MEVKMTMDEVVSKIQDGSIHSFGFRKAFFKDIPDSVPMEYGWFDLTDGDHRIQVEGNILTFEMWFTDHGIRISETAILSRRSGKSEFGTVYQNKLRVKIYAYDIEYIHQDGERIWVQ